MTKYWKMPILHNISGNNRTCGSDLITFVGYVSSLEVTLTVSHILGFLGFPSKNSGVCTKFLSQLVKYFNFDRFWVLTNSKFFSVSKVISRCLMAFLAELKWRQHHRACFRSRKHHRKILALTSRLAGLALHVPFWLSLISQHHRFQWRSQWVVPVCTHNVSQSHLLATLTRLLSGFAHVLFTTSIFGSIVEGFRESIFSRSFQHMLEPFGIFFEVMVAFTGMNGALAFSRPSKNWFGVSAV